MIIHPLKQGLKRHPVTRFVICWAGHDYSSTKTRIETLGFDKLIKIACCHDYSSTKTRIETVLTGLMIMLIVVVMIIHPLKQGLKLSLMSLISRLFVVMIIHPLKQGLKLIIEYGNYK